jgi:hypothetical protein
MGVRAFGAGDCKLLLTLTEVFAILVKNNCGFGQQMEYL